MESAFNRVKAAVSEQAEAILREYGVKHKGDGTLRGTWTDGFLCPFCGDQSGSASFSQELFLRCHQCGRKEDVFEWLAKLLSARPWEICQRLAERLKVDIKIQKPSKEEVRGLPARMKDVILEHVVRALWEAPDAEVARKTLTERRLDDQRALAALGIGWSSGWIIFSQRKEDGTLDEKYRCWAPWSQKAKWRWAGTGRGGPGIWPGEAAPEGKKILLCEGESDVLTARLRLQLPDYHIATWNSGATNCPKASDIPRSWHGREVHLAYDNDVFQGPDYERAQVMTKPGKRIEHARADFDRRLKNLLTRVAPLFESLGCTVIVRKCPIDPIVTYGGDLRDWVNSGGQDFEADWKAFPFKDLPPYGHRVTEMSFDGVFNSIHAPIRARTQVELISTDDIVIPRTLKMECQLGGNPACAGCPGLAEFPDGIIDMDDFQRERVVSMAERDANKWLIENLVQPAKKCPGVELVAQKSSVGSLWAGGRPGQTDDSTQRTLTIFSEEPPSLSGEVEIEGTPYIDGTGKKVIVYAPTVRSLDAREVKIEVHQADYHAFCPWGDPGSVERIDAYLDERWFDLSYNVTRVHGRRDIQVAHDLLMHSVMAFRFNGAMHRGWLDICIYGETRTGKSITFRRMIDHHKLGTYHTAVSNVSRAGLIMGGDNKGMMKPGLLPKCNGKALILDEWHFMVQNAMKSNQDHPMSWMQSARDEGRVSGIKIYGTRDLPAKVRLCIIGNWTHNKRNFFEFACQHLSVLYGSPEVLARSDFSVAVGKEPTDDSIVPTEQFWTASRTRDLIMRAWCQKAEDVLIEPEAESLARQIAFSWRNKYDSDRLPLYTPEEKALSVMRTSVALANMMFSHSNESVYQVVVRPAHVQWAAKWYEHLWQQSGYDRYSLYRRHAEMVDRPFIAERHLTVACGLEDASVAEVILPTLLEPFSLNQAAATFGKDNSDATKWLSALQQLRVVERQRGLNGWNVMFHCTSGGEKLINNLVSLARTDPKSWFDRYQRIKLWTGSVQPPEGLPSMAEERFDDRDTDGQAVPF